jgi:hypothetical protein
MLTEEPLLNFWHVLQWQTAWPVVSLSFDSRLGQEVRAMAYRSDSLALVLIFDGFAQTGPGRHFDRMMIVDSYGALE